MSSRMGRALSIQIFGESHGPFVGVTLDGLPAGIRLDMEEMNRLLRRRAAAGSAIATGRVEKDQPRVISGLLDGVTTGYALTALFENGNTHSGDYAFLPDRPRPGHADYPAYARSAGHDDFRGGGHHSGRLTLPYVFAGGVAMQLLQKQGVQIAARVLRVGDVADRPLNFLRPDMAALLAARERPVPTLDPEAGEKMYQAILSAKEEQDSLGGVVEAVATGLTAGLGAPYFEGAEAVIAGHLFSIPAVKGVEFGAGFAAADMRGSAYNDPYQMENGAVRTARNMAGGLCGGMATGMPVIARAAFRPTASIARPQQTVSLSAMENAELTVHGRHDPCVAVRAVPVVESAMALGLLELWLLRNGDKPLEDGE